MRVPVKAKDPGGWVGSRIAKGDRAGTVIRMATGKIPAAWVKFDDSPEQHIIYLRDLTR